MPENFKEDLFFCYQCEDGENIFGKTEGSVLELIKMLHIVMNLNKDTAAVVIGAYGLFVIEHGFEGF